MSAAGAWTDLCRPFALLTAQASTRPSPDIVWSRCSSLLFELIKVLRALFAAAAQRLHQRQEAREGRAAVEGEPVHAIGSRRVPLAPVPIPCLPCSPRAPFRICPAEDFSGSKSSAEQYAHHRRVCGRRRPQRWQRPSFGGRRRSQCSSGGSGCPRRALVMHAPPHRCVTLA